MQARRTADLIALLDHDYSYATTRAGCADAMGLSRGQFDYLLHENPEATEAWDRARRLIREDRCATRRCSSCGVVKSKREFVKDKRDGCGIGRVCLVCHRLRMRAYRARQ